MHAGTEMYGRERGVEEGRQMHQHCSATSFLTSTGTEATRPLSLPVISVSEVHLGIQIYDAETDADPPIQR